MEYIMPQRFRYRKYKFMDVRLCSGSSLCLSRFCHSLSISFPHLL